MCQLMFAARGEVGEHLGDVRLAEPGRGGVRRAQKSRNTARGEHEDLIAQRQARQLMGHDHHGATAIGEVAEQAHERPGQARVEPRDGLVDEEQRGLRQELERHVGALALAARQLADRRRGLVGDAQFGQHLVDPLRPGGGGDIRGEPEPAGVLEGPSKLQLLVEDVLLGHEADAVAQLGVVGDEVTAAVQDLADRGGAQPGERAQQGRLPRPGRPDDAEQGPLGEGEADVVDERAPVATGDGQADRLEGDLAGVDVLLQPAIHESKLAVAHANEVELAHRRPSGARPVDERPVGAAEVDDLVGPVSQGADLGVMAGHLQVVEDDVVVLGPADPHVRGGVVRGLERPHRRGGVPGRDGRRDDGGRRPRPGGRAR